MNVLFQLLDFSKSQRQYPRIYEGRHLCFQTTNFAGLKTNWYFRESNFCTLISIIKLKDYIIAYVKHGIKFKITCSTPPQLNLNRFLLQTRKFVDQIYDSC